MRGVADAASALIGGRKEKGEGKEEEEKRGQGSPLVDTVDACS